MESIYWYVILASGAIIIIALGGLTIYYRNKLEKCKTTLIRYINENIEMKEKLPEYELPNFINNEEITPSEFSRIMTNVIMKRLLFICIAIRVPNLQLGQLNIIFIKTKIIMDNIHRLLLIGILCAAFVSCGANYEKNKAMTERTTYERGYPSFRRKRNYRQ